jgi:hypothetical protein
MINISVPYEAFKHIYRLDKKFVGTDKYCGFAYFWDPEYKHYLRDTSDARRRLVHKKLLEAGLKLDGKSKEHEAIVLRYYNGKRKKA